MKSIITILIMAVTFNADLYAQSPVFNHAAIYVSNLEKSKTFYKEIVGLNIISDPFKDNMHVWFDMGGGTELHIIGNAKSAKKHPQDVHLSFSVPSIEQFIQKLITAGVSYVNSRNKKNQITTRPDGVKQIYFKDPDGYWIEINTVGNNKTGP